MRDLVALIEQVRRRRVAASPDVTRLSQGPAFAGLRRIIRWPSRNRRRRHLLALAGERRRRTVQPRRAHQPDIVCAARRCAAPGIAIARAQLVSHATLEVAHYDVAPEQIEAELARFDTALAAVRADFEALHGRMKGEDAPAEFGAFLDVHWMILTDTQLSKDPEAADRGTALQRRWASPRK